MLIYNEEQLREIHRSGIDALLNLAGSANHLSKMLDINVMTVKGWVARGRISKEGARSVEQHPTLGKSLKAVTLRPDLNC